MQLRMLAVFVVTLVATSSSVVARPVDAWLGPANASYFSRDGGVVPITPSGTLALGLPVRFRAEFAFVAADVDPTTGQYIAPDVAALWSVKNSSSGWVGEHESTGMNDTFGTQYRLTLRRGCESHRQRRRSDLGESDLQWRHASSAHLHKFQFNGSEVIQAAKYVSAGTVDRDAESVTVGMGVKVNGEANFLLIKKGGEVEGSAQVASKITRRCCKFVPAPGAVPVRVKRCG